MADQNPPNAEKREQLEEDKQYLTIGGNIVQGELQEGQKEKEVKELVASQTSEQSKTAPIDPVLALPTLGETRSNQGKASSSKKGAIQRGFASPPTTFKKTDSRFRPIQRDPPRIPKFDKNDPKYKDISATLGPGLGDAVTAELDALREHSNMQVVLLSSQIGDFGSELSQRESLRPVDVEDQEIYGEEQENWPLEEESQRRHDSEVQYANRFRRGGYQHSDEYSFQEIENQTPEGCYIVCSSKAKLIADLEAMSLDIDVVNRLVAAANAPDEGPFQMPLLTYSNLLKCCTQHEEQEESRKQLIETSTVLAQKCGELVAGVETIAGMRDTFDELCRMRIRLVDTSVERTQLVEIFKHFVCLHDEGERVPVPPETVERLKTADLDTLMKMFQNCKSTEDLSVVFYKFLTQ